MKVDWLVLTLVALVVIVDFALIIVICRAIA